MAAGHKIVVAERDDAGDPGKAVAAAKELIGQGDKIIDGSTSSGVALGLARLAQDNSVLFVTGPAATDGIELRAGRIEVDVSVPLFLPTAARQPQHAPKTANPALEAVLRFLNLALMPSKQHPPVVSR